MPPLVKIDDASRVNPSCDGSLEVHCATAEREMRLHIARRKTPLKVAEWNVRGLNKLGKLQILSKELENMNINITGLSEVNGVGMVISKQ